MQLRLGVDIGGTFTDVIAVTDDTVHIEKVPSTPDAPERAVIDALATLQDLAAPTAIDYFAHGTTVATNAILEENWADTALVTNTGFRDVLEIGRQVRPHIYALDDSKPDPIVPRDRRYEIPGRLDERGQVITPLDEDAVQAVATAIDADSVAVSLLFAFENTAHEERVEDIFSAAGIESISVSSDVLPEIREYERTLATALNAALQPVIDTYLSNLETQLKNAGVTVPLHIMGSNGGMRDAATIRRRPIHTVLSGPAAGVRGAAFVANNLGVRDVVTMDMGGTSCDVSLIEDGDPVVTTDVEVGEYPVAIPMVDVHTVGAGGGSIAWLDSGGALRVGPQSAGANPGPICYGRGGTDPTVTDAHVVLGRIDPASFSGDIGGSRAEAETAIAELGTDMGADVQETAVGIAEVATANTARALRVVSVERGYDPRSLTLVAFGGAGPVHAAGVAAEVGIPHVLIPQAAGVLSALGLLASDLVYESSTSRVRKLDDIDPGALEAAFENLEADGLDRVPDGVPVDQTRLLDLRYVGQSFDLEIPITAPCDEDALATVIERFHTRHESRYGYAASSEPLELVTLRVRTIGRVETPGMDRGTPTGDLAAAREGRRTIRFDTTYDTPIYERSRLPRGATVAGPAIIEDRESTTVVRPDDKVSVMPEGTLQLEVTR